MPKEQWEKEIMILWCYLIMIFFNSNDQYENRRI